MGQWRWGPSAGGGASQGITAAAGSDVQTASTSNQALGGSASNGTPTAWAWTIVTKPSGSSASITSASSQNATLTGIDNGGAYVCRLVVTDSDGYTDADRVVIDYAAAATPTQGITASAGNNVQTSSSSNQALTGSAANVAASSWAWVLTSRPSGSTASITSATSQNATLTGIDNGGAYVATLTATDANGLTDSASVTIDYTAPAAPHTPAWSDIYDIDLTAATGTTLSSGSTTVVDGKTWFCRLRSGDGSMSAVIGATGLVIDFGGTNAGYTRVFVQIPSADLSKDTDGYYPRIRVQMAFSGMTLGTTNSFIGCAIAQDVGTGSGLDNPVTISQYVQTSANNYKWRGESWKGTWGGGASGTTTATGSSNHGGLLGVLEITDIGQGLFRHSGHEGNQTLTAGLDTFRAYSTPTGHNSGTGDTTFYEVGSGGGPWVGFLGRNKASGGSEAITITRIRVQEFV